jgi:hypothetical protein
MNLFAKNRAATAAFVLLNLLHSGAQSISRKTFQFKPLTVAQAKAIEKKLNRKQLPSGVDLGDPDAYVLQSPGAEDLNVIPVYFHYLPPPGSQASSAQCGVFFLKSNEESNYVPVVGRDPSSALCGGVVSVGAMSDPAPRPRLIFIFTIWTAHPGDDYDQPFVLTWNSVSRAYELDKKTSDWLVSQPKSKTIAQVRTLLAQHH